MEKINYRRASLVFILLILISCSTVRDYSEYEDRNGKFSETGTASWYGPNFHGKITANGEVYDMNEFTAAHKSLEFNTIVKVINKSNGKSVIVRINDRGPFVKNRIIDLSKRAAEEIDMIESGFTSVDLIILSESYIENNENSYQYTVQIGSFRNEIEAKKMSSGFDETRVIKTSINGDVYYRVYFGRFVNKTEAERVKKNLEIKGIYGFVKKIR